jgi:nitrite reductase/ring-hydroxylating ferredoxin subunit
MDRLVFLKKGTYACAAALIGPTLLHSCTGMRAVAGAIEDDALVLPLASFTKPDGTLLKYVVVTNERLKQPIVVYRDGPGAYRSLLMRCTHKGMELKVTGDRLDCPAHGSSFDRHGAVLEGPASAPLRTFPTEERSDRIFISLRA